MNEYYIIVFDTTSFVIQAENVIKKKNIPYQIMPTPREIALSCGLSIKFDEPSLGNVTATIKSGEITIKDVYKISGDFTNRVMEKIEL